MKNLLHLILFLILLTTGCEKSGHSNSLLDKIAQILPTNLDSASILLNSIETPDGLNDEEFSKWCMLSGKVTDETIEGLLPVYQWKRAQKWFLKQGTPKEQAQIALYLGRAYVEDGEYDKAMETYTHALFYAKEHKEYNVAGYICTYMADLYSFQDMSDKSLEKQKEASLLFKKAKNIKSYAYALKNLAVEWAYIDSFGYAIQSVNKAESIAITLHNNNLNKAVANAQGNIYMMKEQYDQAIPYFIKATQIKGNEAIKDSMALIILYIKTNKLVKARNLLDNIAYRHEVAYGINKIKYMLYKAEDNYKEALHYKEICDDILDSITIVQNETKVLNIEKKYNDIKIREENIDLKIAQQKNIILLTISISISLLLTLSYFLNKQKIKTKIYKQQTELDNIRIELLHLKNKKATLENMLTDTTKKDQEMQQEIENLTTLLQQAQRQQLLTSNIGKKLKALTMKKPGPPSKTLSSKLWKEVTLEVRKIYPKLYTHLLDQCPNLTEQDWQYCCLHIFGFDGNDEAKLLEINPDSVRMKRTRIKQKLNIQLNENINLRNFLIEYMLN